MRKQDLTLRSDHGWKSEEGYKIFVADRGAVRFDFPKDWIVKFKEKSVSFHDFEPTDDTGALEMSFNRLPPNDWTTFPLKKALQQILDDDDREILHKGKITSANRDGMRLVWTDIRYIDATEKREATSRILVGIGGNVQVLFTFDYWTEGEQQMREVWEAMLRSLRLGLFIPDPTRGHVVNPSLN
jgi:hypothetical protein